MPLFHRTALSTNVEITVGWSARENNICAFTYRKVISHHYTDGPIDRKLIGGRLYSKYHTEQQIC